MLVCLLCTRKSNQIKGLMYFCINDKIAIKTVVDCLRIPSLETRVRSLVLNS